MKLHKSAIYLAATDVTDKIYDLAESNTVTLQELAENSFMKSYDIEQTAQLRREITFDNIICNLIEFDVSSKSPETNLTDLSRLSKSASVLNYNVYLNSRNSSQFLTRAERSSSDEVSSESNTTENKKTTRKVSKISDFYLSNKILNNLEKYTKKKKSKLVHKKHHQMKKMNRIEIDSDFYLAPLDHEYKDYVRQKKEIREKLHDHWKIELNTHQKDKILKINNDVYSSEQQWMTICNNKTKEEEKAENSLIDTFTANIENSNNEKMDSYKVNSEIGTLIAQKLLKGEKIRVGRNGALTGADGVERGQTFVKLFETFKLPPSGSILSWDDQVAKHDIKIIQPKVAVTDIQKKPKMERNLIVKKLNEEEEFKPVIKKQNQIASPPTSAALSPIKQQNRTDKSISMQTLTTTNTHPKPAVEIVGTNTVGHPFQQHLKHSHKSDSSSSLSKTNNASNSTTNNNSNKNNDWSLDSTVVKQHINTLSSNHNKTTSAKVAMNNLSEKNYLQIIDNLTSRYTSSVERTKVSNENNATNSSTSSSKKVINKINKKDHKDKVLEFINDLGLKSTETKRRKGTSSASFKSHSSNNLNTNHNLKELTPINNTLTNNKENKLDNTKTSESNNTSNKNNNNITTTNNNNNNDNLNKNSQHSFSPRTYSSFSQANTFKLNPSEKSIKSKTSITGLNSLSTISSSKINNTKAILKASVSTTTLNRRRKLFKVAESSAYFNIVKPLEPKSRLPDITSSFKQLIFDINKSDSAYLTPISPSTSFLTR